MDSYEKATLKDEFCYRQYSDSTVDYNLDNLPPVSNQGGRYRKARIWPPPLSMKDILHNLQDLTDREGFSLDHCSLFMGSSFGLNSDSELSDYGEIDGMITEVLDDEELTEEDRQQLMQFGVSRINNYTLVGQRAEGTDGTMKFDDVVKEIRNNGPVVATFSPDWDFSYWRMEYASNYIYEGLCFAELSEADKKKHRGHVVALIGFGSGEKKYFIAQNSHGLNWGDNGMFRLDPSCVRRVSVPILERPLTANFSSDF